jgi:D-alanyl-D-alanine carboxypeptidase
MRQRPRRSSLAALLITAAVACTSGPRTTPASPTHAATPFDSERATQLQEALERALTETGAPGAQAAVVLTDGSLWTGAAGLSDIDRGLPMTTGDLMLPASVSKVYTATLALLLAEDGSLSLDDPLLRWLPDVPNADGVTVRQLLNHSSGIASDDPALPRVCDPGTCHSYSNAAYNMLARVVEAASGRSLAEVLRARISRSLGLEATFVPSGEAVRGRPAMGYDAADDATSALEVVAAPDSYSAGSGGVVATAADVARFGHALFTGDVLGPDALAELLDFDATRGLPGSSECSGEAGVLRHSGEWGESWFHGGFAGSFRAWVEHYPRYAVTVMVMVNSDEFLGLLIERLTAAALEGAPVVDEGAASGRCVYDIAVLEPDGSDRLITDDARFETAPSWSWNSGILWSRIEGDWMDVFLLDPGSGSARRHLTDDPTNEVFARSSPLDGEIVFASNADGDYDLFLMRADGSRVRKLTRNSWDDIFPAWSQDGRRIAYVDTRDGSRIRVMDRDGRHSHAITAGPEDEWPAWSPDGEQIVYEAGGVLLVIPDEGGEPVRVPIPQIRVTSFPSWAPSDRIAFESDLDLWSVRADGTGLRRLTSTSTEESFPAWGPDGSIVYQLGRWIER